MSRSCWRLTGLRAHPVSFLRGELTALGIRTRAAAMQARDGISAEVTGLVLVRQWPGSARGVIFITIEDGTGIANLVVWPDIFEARAVSSWPSGWWR